MDEFDNLYSLDNYHAAIALNNMANTLLQRGCYRAARLTLNDSIILMKETFVYGKNERDDCKISTENNNHTSLMVRDEKKKGRPNQNANLKNHNKHKNCRLLFSEASARYTKVLSTSPGAQTRRQHSLTIATRSNEKSQPKLLPCHCSQLFSVRLLEDDDLSEVLAAANYGSSTSIIFPIRISSNTAGSFSSTFCLPSKRDQNDLTTDDSLHMGDDTVREITKNFGIILYNYGLATWLLSQEKKEDETIKHGPAFKKKTEKRLRQSAFSSLKVAKTSFLSVFETLKDNLSQENLGRRDPMLSYFSHSNSPDTFYLSKLEMNIVKDQFYRQDLIMSALFTVLCSNIENILHSQYQKRPCNSNKTAMHKGELPTVVLPFLKDWTDTICSSSSTLNTNECSNTNTSRSALGFDETTDDTMMIFSSKNFGRPACAA